MSLLEWAKNELEITMSGCEAGESSEMQNMMHQNVLELLEVFCNQGHSGFSAPYAIRMFTRLANWKPLSPLTGEDDEWSEIKDGQDKTVQNIRCSAVFKNYEIGGCYYIDGKVFSDDGGKTWYTCKDSHIPITFPFTVPDKPERFVTHDGGKTWEKWEADKR